METIIPHVIRNNLALHIKTPPGCGVVTCIYDTAKTQGKVVKQFDTMDFLSYNAETDVVLLDNPDELSPMEHQVILELICKGITFILVQQEQNTNITIPNLITNRLIVIPPTHFKE